MRTALTELLGAVPSAGPIAAPILQSTFVVAALAGAAAESASARRTESDGRARATIIGACDQYRDN